MKTIWCITDDKPGHLAQLNGLLVALKKRENFQSYFIQTSGSINHIQSMAKPDIILCAGHRTHWRALTLSWRFKAKLIVLMKPSLPKFLFDVCIVPEHDNVAGRNNIIITKGALNTVELQSNANPQQGLILLGGPSKHYRWSEADFLRQVSRLCHLLPDMHWVLSTSRRTPHAFVSQLLTENIENLSVVPVESTDSAWLQEHYQMSSKIWVTEDSASMVYESLSTGAQVGVLAMPRLAESRVSGGVDQLIDSGVVSTIDYLDKTGGMLENSMPLREADRVADLLLQKFL